MANDAFHRIHVAEPPLLEPVLDIDQHCTKLIQGKVLVGVATDFEPDVSQSVFKRMGTEQSRFSNADGIENPLRNNNLMASS